MDVHRFKKELFPGESSCHLCLEKQMHKLKMPIPVRCSSNLEFKYVYLDVHVDISPYRR